MGVLSSWVTAFRKLSCCSLRRISRTRKIVLRTRPAIITPKKMMPSTMGTTFRQLSTIQLTFSANASPTRQTPRVMKNAIVLARLVIRMRTRRNCSGYHRQFAHVRSRWENCCMKKSAVILRYALSLFLTLSIIPAAAQKSGGTLPDAPAAKTQNPTMGQASPFKDQKEKVSYALGMNMGSNLRRQGIDIDPNVLSQGLKDGLSGGKTVMTEDEMVNVLTQWQTDNQARQAEKQRQLAESNQKEGEAFLAANKTKEGVVALPSGLQYKVLTQGTGPKPTAEDSVVCNYRGTLIDGKEFDSSYKRGEPATFPVSRVIKGWTEALQLMPVGSKWQLFIPPDLAYGPRGAGQDIGPNSTLIFEVELLSIQEKEKPVAPAPTPQKAPSPNTSPAKPPQKVPPP